MAIWRVNEITRHVPAITLRGLISGLCDEGLGSGGVDRFIVYYFTVSKKDLVAVAPTLSVTVRVR